ncbi:MAG: hypothetical protein HOP17_13225 [Acidobacteria bacterium]|nr:hypothetical protein [Acidobacteriota bacterium]
MCFTVVGVISVAAQIVPPPKPPKVEVKPKPEKKTEPEAPPEKPEKPSKYYGRGTTEKALAVDPNVNIKIPCILQGRVTVNGWDRNEIRLFIRNGSDAKFRVLEKDPKSVKPVWVLIAKQAADVEGSECLSGDRIDIEVPYGASLSITGKRTEARIDSIKKINLESVDGNVAFRNISGGISSRTYKGSVTVEGSGGEISLETTEGNVNAYGVSPGKVGDVFRAKTNSGRITLQNVEHRQIVADSVTGELIFRGKFLPGGLYALTTTAGSIALAIPVDSSCRVSALYGGTLDSSIPFKTVTKNISPAGSSLNAVMGDGASTVKLTTHNGMILISKL